MAYWWLLLMPFFFDLSSNPELLEELDLDTIHTMPILNLKLHKSTLPNVFFPPIIALLYFAHGAYYYGIKKDFVKPKIPKRTEKAYKRTNLVPFVDSILELPIAYKEGNKPLVILNFLFFLAQVGNVVFYIIDPDGFRQGSFMESNEDYADFVDFADEVRAVDAEFWYKMANVSLTSLQFFGDLNEFLVITKM